MSKREFKVGDEVVVTGGGFHGRTTGPHKILKQYANGNFIVDTYGTQQFGPGGHGTGHRFHGPMMLHHDDPAAIRLLLEAKVASTKRHLLRRIDDISDGCYDGEEIAAALLRLFKAAAAEHKALEAPVE